MSTIRCVYHPIDGAPRQPSFPATDQHPDAARYLVGPYYVDAIGGEPNLADIEALLRPSPPLSLERDRERDVKKLEALVESLPFDEQAVPNLILKILKGES